MKILFSTFINSKTLQENSARHRGLIGGLKNNPLLTDFVIKEINGSWRGEEEKSFLLDGFVTDEVINFTMKLCEWFEQEAFLLVMDSIESAYLFKRGSTGNWHNPIWIGFWTKVTKEKALLCDSWTRINNEYFIVKEF